MSFPWAYYSGRRLLQIQKRPHKDHQACYKKRSIFSKKNPLFYEDALQSGISVWLEFGFINSIGLPSMPHNVLNDFGKPWKLLHVGSGDHAKGVLRFGQMTDDAADQDYKPGEPVIWWNVQGGSPVQYVLQSVDGLFKIRRDEVGS